MKTSFWRRWWKSLSHPKQTRPVSRRWPRHLPLQLETLEDRVLPSLTSHLILDVKQAPLGAIPSRVVAIGSMVFFSADDGIHGQELWKSDGTAAGTVLVKDINPGSAGSNPGRLTNVNGTLFFTATDSANGVELWKSDGTEAGTVPLGGGSYIANLTNTNGTLFFTAYDSTHGYELWESDGTAAGTVVVKDINPGSAGSNPRYLTNVNGTLFFTADDGTHGDELWKSDGTEAGTVLVKDINAGSATSFPGHLTNVNGTLFLSASDGVHGGLWKSDGTEAGTVFVKNIFPAELANVNGTLFLSASDGTHGEQLWKSDGTTAGTVLVKDIYPFNDYAGIGSLTNVNGTLFFTASPDGPNGELWKSDGTAAGTVLVKDSNAGYLTNVNGTLFFSSGVTGGQLWESDGTTAGTVLVRDTNPVGGYLANLIDANGTLFFSSYDGVPGIEPWVVPSVVLGGAPNSSPAGTPITVTGIVRAPDAGATYTVAWVVTKNGSDFATGSGAAFTFTPYESGCYVATLTVTDDAGGSDTRTASITVTPAAADHILITGPTSASAGTPFDLVVTIQDQYGNTVTGYTGTVTFSVTDTDPAVVLPADYTFSADDQGTHTFTGGFTLITPGEWTLTVADLANGLSQDVILTVNP